MRADRDVCVNDVLGTFSGEQKPDAPRFCDEHDDLARLALKGDQCTGVEDDAAHAAEPESKRRAAARSFFVGGPPVAASISAMSSSKSASAASWPTTACSMYPDTLRAWPDATRSRTCFSTSCRRLIATFAFRSIPFIIPGPDRQVSGA